MAGKKAGCIAKLQVASAIVVMHHDDRCCWKLEADAMMECAPDIGECWRADTEIFTILGEASQNIGGSLEFQCEASKHLHSLCVDKPANMNLQAQAWTIVSDDIKFHVVSNSTLSKLRSSPHCAGEQSMVNSTLPHLFGSSNNTS